MRPRLLLIPLLSLLFLLSGCSRGTGGAPGGSPTLNSPSSSASLVQATADAVQIAAGGSADVTVHLTIQRGYHVNANPATESYLRPTELTVQNTDALSVGFVTYPSALTKTFSFSPKPLAVYEGETTIKVRLRATKSAAKGQHSLAAKLSLQACDDQVCYAPGVVELTIPVTIN